MSKKSCSPDNSVCEEFYCRMKNKIFYGRKWNNTSIEKFVIFIYEYMIWYNTKRIKQSLNYLSQKSTDNYGILIKIGSINCLHLPIKKCFAIIGDHLYNQ